MIKTLKICLTSFFFFFLSFQNLKAQDDKLIEKRIIKLNTINKIKVNYNSLVLQQIRKFEKRKSFPKTMGLAEFYFPLFKAKLDQYGLPEELKYLTVVESNLKSKATSRVGAQGLWQFMRPTGRQFGLYENNKVSLFNDPVASTDAACRYLKYLYKELKNWELALAAYNCGIGRVKKILKKTGKKSFWQIINYLPKETQLYVPSFLAVQYLMNFYKEHKIKPYTFAVAFREVEIIKAKRNIYIDKIHFLNQRDKRIFIFLNPHIKTGVIPEGTYYYKKRIPLSRR
ncbi:lytic transglycosylase domain-containing protein (plasmid) [Aquimarina sp. TRL1]|uniref:lytic transglycosylase domain-containing protein n=1 Tax=Aquimarina sp. (strain TRL1) TaxID=2736252 RepID=UPI00158B114C|nr:lytic transglycosylase domain-containing protein [Aquimarina sp. TRL1]QKX07731.1 lytic transglycosylase domain-containing protein [Aquimarina sp. TRL1]